MTNYSWASTGATITGQSTNAITASWATAGSKTLTVTYTDANGCTGTSAPYTVTINPTPVITATPSDHSVCAGLATTAISFTSTVTGTTYSWTGTATAGTTIPSLQYQNGTANPIPSYTGLQNSTTTNGTVTYTITPAAGGCPGQSITATIQVKPIPIATVLPSTQSICSEGC
jgi:hypothetical protein